jgi:hypothetical protein
MRKLCNLTFTQSAAICLRLNVRSGVQARFLKGDTDAPESHWVVGEAAEMFDYKLLGVHRVASGFTCIVNSPDAKPGQVEKFIPALDEAAQGLTWKDFADRASHAHGEESKRDMEGQSEWWPPGFVWAGRLVDCASAAVYIKKDGTGLWIHSNYDPLDW